MTLLKTEAIPRSPLPKEPRTEKTCVIFDLYGTLIQLDTRSLLRRIAKYFGVRISPELMRQTLTLNYPDQTSAAKGFLETLLKRDVTDEELDHCMALVAEHLSRAELIKGAEPLLAFLRRRGRKIALLSNVAQIFKQPFYDLGLDQYFDVIHFSSDTGYRKPNPDAYLNVCKALGATPQECFFFGDDAKNDYDAPLLLNMRPIHIGTAPRAETVEQISDLFWASMSGELMLARGKKIKTDRGKFVVEKIEQLNDDDLGIYNVVARLFGHDQDGNPEMWYAKRFLDTSSVQVELLAHEVMALLEISVPRAFMTETAEPILFTSPAKGRLWEKGDFDLSVAEDLGAQAAAAYIVSNADWRPRNTFLCKQSRTLTCIDLEHCLFDRVLEFGDRAIDVTDAKAIDALGLYTSRVTRARVLSDGAVRRARRCFTRNEDRSSEEIQLFLKGWNKTFTLATERKQEIADTIRNRMQSGQLMIGTKSHRRAFASVDLHDLLERIHLGKPVMFKDHIWSAKS